MNVCVGTYVIRIQIKINLITKYTFCEIYNLEFRCGGRVLRAGREHMSSRAYIACSSMSSIISLGRLVRKLSHKEATNSLTVMALVLCPTRRRTKIPSCLR